MYKIIDEAYIDKYVTVTVNALPRLPIKKIIIDEEEYELVPTYTENIYDISFLNPKKNISYIGKEVEFIWLTNNQRTIPKDNTREENEQASI